jgi:hypothetical protein
MPASRKDLAESRERAVWLVLEAHEQEPGLSLNAAVLRIGPTRGEQGHVARAGASRRRLMRPPAGHEHQ